MRLWLLAIGMLLMAAADADVDRALGDARARAAAGDVVAQFSLGSLLYYGSRDMAQATDWIGKAAAQNYPPAEFHMGQLYDFGFGVGQSDRDALAWYRRAAQHGSAAALSLGRRRA
jgi:TPR repeat protein